MNFIYAIYDFFYFIGKCPAEAGFFSFLSVLLGFASLGFSYAVFKRQEEEKSVGRMLKDFRSIIYKDDNVMTQKPADTLSLGSAIIDEAFIMTRICQCNSKFGTRWLISRLGSDIHDFNKDIKETIYFSPRPELAPNYHLWKKALKKFNKTKKKVMK